MTFDSDKRHRRSLRLKHRDYSRDGYYFVTICARNRENLFANLCVGAGLAPALDHGHPQGVPLQQKMTPARDSSHNFVEGHPQGVPLQQKMTPARDSSHDIVEGQPQGLPLHRETAPIQVCTNGFILTTAGQIIEKNWHKIATPTVKTDAFVIMPNHIHGIIIINPHTLCVGAGLAPALDSLDIDQGQPQGLPLHREIAPAPVLGTIIGAFKSRCVKDYLKYIDEINLNESAKIWQRNYYEHIIRDRNELAAIRNYIKSNPENWTMDEENPLNFFNFI